MHALELANAMLFLSTLSLRRATVLPDPCGPQKTNFYPRSPCGERPPAPSRRKTTDMNFYPRSPCGERRIIDIINNVVDNFYPRSPCGERLEQSSSYSAYLEISIHALLAESDVGRAQGCWLSHGFLSTLSLRRATACLLACFVGCFYFYPRSPCGERRYFLILQ